MVTIETENKLKEEIQLLLFTIEALNEEIADYRNELGYNIYD